MGMANLRTFCIDFNGEEYPSQDGGGDYCNAEEAKTIIADLEQALGLIGECTACPPCKFRALDALAGGASKRKRESACSHEPLLELNGKRRIVELEQQLADERLAFDHANEVIGKLEADIAALSWTRITLENLPKMGDMVLIFDGDYCVDNVLQPFANGKKNQLKGWKNIGASHRRPINPPTPSGAKGETKP
jgi:hypothetical protein